MKRSDVLIVGAGPAGSATAIQAGAAGLSVQLLDKATFPRDKTCGDGLTTLALRELDALGFGAPSVTSWRPIEGVDVTTPNGRVVRLDLPADGADYVAIAPRTEIDDSLLSLARDAGAEIREGTAVTGVETRPADQCWRVTCDDGAVFEARYVVHAGGARGLPGLRQGRSRYGRGDEVIASRLYLTDVRPLDDRAHLWFWEQVLPGYAWLFPVGEDRANVGVVLHTKGRSPSELVAATGSLTKSDWLFHLVGGSARRQGPLRVWPIPSRMSRSPASGGVLRIGDAAGLSDPMTGEGIAQALVSARLAIDSINGHFDRPLDASSAYRDAVRREFAADQRTSRILLWPLRRATWADAAVRFMGRTEGTSEWFARWTFEDVPRRSVLSPAKLLRSLDRPSPPSLQAEGTAQR